MILSRSGLQTVLNQNAVELRFKRRIPKPGFNFYRRMFCTNDFTLLKSPLGKKILNFRPPTGRGLSYDPASKNLIITWDIFYQDWRAINCDLVETIAVIRTSPPQQFWNYFFKNIKNMSAAQKAQFMNI